MSGGMGAAIAFLFTPDFSKVTWDVALAAIGLGFFSIGVGIGVGIGLAEVVQEAQVGGWAGGCAGAFLAWKEAEAATLLSTRCCAQALLQRRPPCTRLPVPAGARRRGAEPGGAARAQPPAGRAAGAGAGAAA